MLLKIIELITVKGLILLLCFSYAVFAILSNFSPLHITMFIVMVIALFSPSRLTEKKNVARFVQVVMLIGIITAIVEGMSVLIKTYEAVEYSKYHLLTLFPYHAIVAVPLMIYVMVTISRQKQPNKSL